MTFKRRIYLIIESLLIYIYTLFNIKQHNSGIAIVKIDAIGDYILIRNFINEIKTSTKYKNSKLTLIGNVAWRDIAESLDNNIVDFFIWIERDKVWDIKSYRINLIKKLSRIKYDTIISPIFSRDFATDSLIKILNSKNKIGSYGDELNLTQKMKLITNKYYTQLIPVKDGIMFEFERNKYFFENLLGRKLSTKLEIIPIRTKYNGQFHNYVVLFVGASSKNRKWSIENFIEIANWLNNFYKVSIIFCGGENDIIDNSKINLNFMTNLTGQTSLIELIDIISMAQFVISNETAIPHICIAVGVKVFVLYNGKHFGRFIEYPKEITNNYFAIYHPYINNNKKEYQNISNLAGFEIKLDINEITTDVVKHKIMENIYANSKK